MFDFWEKSEFISIDAFFGRIGDLVFSVPDASGECSAELRFSSKALHLFRSAEGMRSEDDKSC